MHTSANLYRNAYTDPGLIERAAAALQGDVLMTPPETAAVYRISLSTLWQRARRGLLPSPIRLGAKCTRWKASDIRAHLESLSSGAKA